MRNSLPSSLCVQRRGSSTGGKSEYSVIKQDTEELGQACKVMEDLIRMQLSLFTVSSNRLSNHSHIACLFLTLYQPMTHRCVMVSP